MWSFGVKRLRPAGASNLLDGVVVVTGFFGPLGWIVGGAYLLADLTTKGITGQSIGDHLNRLVEEKFDLNNGAIISFK